MRLFGKEFTIHTTTVEVKKVIEKKVEKISEPFSIEQEKRLAQIFNEAFERNRSFTRLTCWFCDRAIDENQGYIIWLGVKLHNECTELFKDKMRPIITQSKLAHSNLLWESLPVFMVDSKTKQIEEPKKSVKAKTTKDTSNE